MVTRWREHIAVDDVVLHLGTFAGVGITSRHGSSRRSPRN
jgi:hypothetical protein